MARCARPIGETAAETSGLPRGPRLPVALQTVLLWGATQPFLDACQRRFGDTFTLEVAPVGTVVVFADPAAIRRIFTGGDETFRGGNDVMRLSLGSTSSAVVHGEEHLSTRRAMLPMLHGEAVGRYEGLVRELTRDMVGSWPSGRPFALLPQLRQLTLEVILRAVIGATERTNLSAFRAALPRFVDIGPVIELLWVAPWLGRVGPWRRYLRSMRRADRLLYDEIASRREDPCLDQRTDVLSLLIRDGCGPSDGDRDTWLRDQLVTLMLAGQDTTANALAWTIECLLRTPPVLARAIAAAHDDDRDYLDAVVQEGLRAKPVIFQVARKLTQPVSIEGRVLPAGLTVAPAIGLTQRSAKSFPDPASFDPERFLESGQVPPYAWIPFGGGVRRCPGAALASMEIRTVLQEILLTARLELASRRPERTRPRHITIAPARGVRVVLERRLAAAPPAGRPPVVA